MGPGAHPQAKVSPRLPKPEERACSRFLSGVTAGTNLADTLIFKFLAPRTKSQHISVVETILFMAVPSEQPPEYKTNERIEGAHLSKSNFSGLGPSYR